VRVNEVTIFRMWVWASAAIALGFCVWTFVPILIPFGVVAGVLGAFAYGVRTFARRIEQRRDQK
jgi:membrane protein implicated in regulation of membrane protease activity